eukprot:gene23741-9299_t
MPSDDKPDRPDIVRLFDKYGDVERIDMKTGFAFLYMRDKRDAEVAIKKLDGMEFGYKRRRLRNAEVAKKKDNKPTDTIFVVNFDLKSVRERDIERFFEPYGKIIRVEIKRNYAFVQFSTVDEAARAMDKADGTKLDGRTIAIEYTQKPDHYQNERGRMGSRSPPRRGRSPSYDRGRSHRSRSPVRRRGSPSPIRRRRSQSPLKRSDNFSPVRRRDSHSPIKSRSPVRSSRSPVRRRGSPSRSASPGRY